MLNRSFQNLCSVFVLLGLILNGFEVRSAPAAAPSSSTKKAVPPDFADIVEPLRGTVVNISTVTETPRNRMPMEMPNFPQGSPLEEFFRYFQEGPQSRPRKTASLGSGFIIAQEGKETFIVTCNHVVADADTIIVILDDTDKIEYDAQIVGRDRRTDIALLKITTDKKLPTISWGNSNRSRVGEWVIAIGNPYGLSNTVTKGIISDTERDLSSRAPNLAAADYVSGYFQIDASINVGNSGGPIFDINGQVIGINTAILSPNGGSIGIGFAIPESTARKVVEQLKKHGRTKRGWLGVKIQPVTQDIATSLGLKKAVGALVGSISSLSPATKAGIKSGDVILSFNNQEIKESRMLPYIVGESPIGDKVPLIVLRNGQEVKLEIVVGEFEEAEKEGLILLEDTEDKKSDKSQNSSILGMSYQEIKPSQYEHFGVTEETKGLLINYVDPDSEAAEKGVRSGDMLGEVKLENIQERITTISQLTKFIEKAKKDKKKIILLFINRGKESRFITLSLVEENSEDKDKKSKN